MIALAEAAAPNGLVVPLCDVREAALVAGDQVRGAATLADLVAILRGQSQLAGDAGTGRVPSTPRLWLTCPTSGVRPSVVGRSRWPRRGATTSS